MSKPLNALAEFRTYSYHHVLIACDSTETAKEISRKSFGRDANDRPTFLTDAFKYRNPEDRVDEIGLTASGGRYLVLINGFRDAQFVIQSARWGTVIAPDTTTEDGTNLGATIELDGQLTIVEPYGIDFMRVIPDACAALERDPAGIIFLLKTFFVGHRDDGAVDVISNVKPLMFFAYDLTADFTENASTYVLSFVGMANGAAKLLPVNELASSVNIGPKINDKRYTNLGKLITEGLDTIVKDLYAKQKEELARKYAADGRVLDDDFMDVIYRFEVDEAYMNEKFVFGDNEPSQYKDKAGPIITGTATTSFEKLLETIMMSSKAVVDEANNDKQKYIFKIVSSVTSTNKNFIVTYRVQRYLVEFQSVPDGNTPQKFKPKEGQVIEFDYIFTGKNTDVLSFDIKMELGLAFFQMLTTTNNLPNQQESLVGVQQNLSSGQAVPPKSKSNAQPAARRRSPLFLGSQVTEPKVRNKVNSVSSSALQKAIARHAALENIQAKAVITGNPELLSELAAIDDDFRKHSDGTAEVNENSVNPRWTSVPTYAKINIRMPTNDRYDDFAQGFWYDGYFQIFGVNNIFENGSFTQELDLISMPYADPIDNQGDADVVEQRGTPQTPTVASEPQPANEIPPVNAEPGTTTVIVPPPAPVRVVNEAESLSIRQLRELRNAQRTGAK